MCIEKDIKKLENLCKHNCIGLRFDQINKILYLENYAIYYTNILSAIQTFEEIFINRAYYFYTNKESPFIIDAGSEVGMATIFFKMLYPKAKIICFEAHPDAYNTLKKNIEINKLDNIIPINSAIINAEGEINFFGEFGQENPDTRGSSVIDSWGLQRTTSSKTQVKASRLSSYINDNIAFLKLNIEGAEQQVIEDLEQAGKTKFIEKVLIKFHHSKITQEINNLDKIKQVLQKNNLIIKKMSQKTPSQVFPHSSENWAKNNEVVLYNLYAEK